MVRSKLSFQLLCVWALCLMHSNFCQAVIKCLVIVEPGEPTGYSAIALLAKYSQFIEECGSGLYTHDSSGEALSFVDIIFQQSPNEVDWRLGKTSSDIKTTPEMSISARVLIMRPFKDLADAIKYVHETKLRNAVIEIVLAWRYKEIVASGEHLISSHLKMDMNSLVSVLQHKSIRHKFKLLYTNLKSNYALTRFQKKLPKLFHQLDKNNNSASKYLREFRPTGAICLVSTSFNFVQENALRSIPS